MGATFFHNPKGLRIIFGVEVMIVFVGIFAYKSHDWSVTFPKENCDFCWSYTTMFGSMSEKDFECKPTALIDSSTTSIAPRKANAMAQANEQLQMLVDLAPLYEHIRKKGDL